MFLDCERTRLAVFSARYADCNYGIQRQQGVYIGALGDSCGMVHGFVRLVSMDKLLIAAVCVTTDRSRSDRQKRSADSSDWIWRKGGLLVSNCWGNGAISNTDAGGWAAPREAVARRNESRATSRAPGEWV
jgi:hypothetical protein